MSHIISQYAIRLTLFCIMLCSIATFRPSRRIFIFCFSPGERRPPKKRSTFFLVRIGRLNLLLSSTVVRHYGLIWHPTRRLRRLNGIAVADVIMNLYLQSATEKRVWWMAANRIWNGQKFSGCLSFLQSSAAKNRLGDTRSPSSCTCG